MKQTIRLNERELHSLISESVKRVLNEKWTDKDDDDFWRQRCPTMILGGLLSEYFVGDSYNVSAIQNEINIIHQLIPETADEEINKTIDEYCEKARHYKGNGDLSRKIAAMQLFKMYDN